MISKTTLDDFVRDGIETLPEPIDLQIELKMPLPTEPQSGFDEQTPPETFPTNDPPAKGRID